MTTARAFALLFVLAFYGVAFVGTDSPVYYAGGFVLLAGIAVIAYGVTHRTSRR